MSGKPLSSSSKGHLCLKSSPFAVTSAKLSSQFMVQDQMNAHYRMINTAKSTIDNGPPKAWLSSQKVRDRAKREKVKKDVARRKNWLDQNDGSRPASAPVRARGMGSRASLQEQNDVAESVDDVVLTHALLNNTYDLNGGRGRSMRGSGGGPERELTQEERNLLLIEQIVQDTLRSTQQLNGTASLRPPSAPVSRTSRPASALELTRTRNRAQPTPRQKSADILDKHDRAFTPSEKLFTPRILKSNRQSKLGGLGKFYRAPKKKVDGDVSQQRAGTPLTEIALDETLQSRDFERLKSGATDDVPPLDISLDADHLRWLKDQAEKASARDAYELDPHSTQNLGVANTNLGRTYSENGKLNTTGLNGRSSSKSVTMQRVDDEEEELKYLEFVTDVTNDVLQRGIFTNRVLKQVFEYHIEKRKNQLKISRMRAMLDTLREDLGIPADDAEDEEDVGMKTQRLSTSASAEDLHTANDSRHTSTISNKASKDKDRLSSSFTSSNGHRVTEKSSDMNMGPKPEQRTIRKIADEPLSDIMEETPKPTPRKSKTQPAPPFEDNEHQVRFLQEKNAEPKSQVEGNEEGPMKSQLHSLKEKTAELKSQVEGGNDEGPMKNLNAGMDQLVIIDQDEYEDDYEIDEDDYDDDDDDDELGGPPKSPWSVTKDSGEKRISEPAKDNKTAYDEDEDDDF